MTQAEERAAATDAYVREHNIRGGCSVCSAVGYYSLKHDGCTGYFTCRHSNGKSIHTQEYGTQKGYCSNCCQDFTGGPGNWCEGCGGRWVPDGVHPSDYFKTAKW